MAENPLRHTDQSAGPHLRYLDDAAIPPGPQLDADVTVEVAERYAWLVDRLIARISVRWPAEIDLAWLRSHALAALARAVEAAADEDDLPEAAVAAVGERLRTLLAGTEWYRHAMLGRARPLCEAWRGALLAGRQPTDRLLCMRLHVGMAELTERFVELATIFAIEPAGLMPGGRELFESVTLAVAGLPTEQQLLVSLYFEQGFTLAEIARVLEVLPVRAQELLGRAAAAIAGEAVLADWPAVAMRA